MIRFYNQLAIVFYPMRFIILTVSVVSLCASAYILLSEVESQQALLKPLMIAGIWLLLLVSISYFFISVPNQPSADSGLIQRFISRSKRFLCGAFAWVFTLITLLSVYLGVKTLLMGG